MGKDKKKRRRDYIEVSTGIFSKIQFKKIENNNNTTNDSDIDDNLLNFDISDDDDIEYNSVDEDNEDILSNNENEVDFNDKNWGNKKQNYYQKEEDFKVFFDFKFFIIIRKRKIMMN